MIFCPECSSKEVWKDGIRCTSDVQVQRYVCRKCGFRFSESSTIRRRKIYGQKPSISRQICVAQTKGTKNLIEVENPMEVAQREGTTKNAEIKGKLVEFTWWMNKQGYSKGTNCTYIKCL